MKNVALITGSSRGIGAAAAQLLGESAGVGNEDTIDIGHAEVRLQQRVDQKRVQLFPQRRKPGAADSSKKQAGLPAKLHQNADGQQPQKRHAAHPVLLPQIIHDCTQITHKQNRRHVAVISPGCALDHDGHGVRRKGLRQQRAAEPPAQDQQRPFQQVLILGNPEPDPGKIREAIAHGHPQQHPEEAVPLGNGAGVAQQVENAVVHQHIHKPHHKAHQNGHALFLPQQQGQEHAQKGNVQPDVKGRELAACDNLLHRLSSLPRRRAPRGFQYWFTQLESSAAGTSHSAMKARNRPGVREAAAPT